MKMTEYYSLMELSTSWEAANCAATQELRSILWNPKVHYRVHMSPPLVPILNHINSIHTIPSYLRSILILSTHLRLGLPSGLFWLSHQYPICIPLLPYLCYMPCPSNPAWDDRICLSLIWTSTWGPLQEITQFKVRFVDTALYPVRRVKPTNLQFFLHFTPGGRSVICNLIHHNEIPLLQLQWSLTVGL
jgi:hypothetical protein